MLKTVLCLVSVLALASCANLENNDTREVSVNNIESSDIVTTQNTANFSAETNNQVATLASSSSTLPYGSYLEFPETPSVGECFAKVEVPGQYKYKTEKVLVRPERKVVDTIPAEYGMRTKEIVTREATTNLKVIPATYKQVSERVMVTPERRELRAIPATYRTVTEKVMVKPERKVWKVGREWKQGSVATKYGKSGEIRCLVKLPAVYENITKRVVDQPARTSEVIIPATYRTVTKTVVDQPAQTLEIEVPAQSKTVNVREVVSAPRSVERIIPAVYKNKSYKVAVQEPYEMWSAILCRTNDNTGKVKELQAKLNELGYTRVDVDGIIGPSTHRAVKHYQENTLSKSYYDGRITYDTLRSLNLL